MIPIKNIETVDEIFHDWDAYNLAFIKKIEWADHNMKIIFLWQSRTNIGEWPNISQFFYELSFLFEKVSNLKLDFPGSEIHQIMGLDIVDVSNNGWENVNFQIDDYESGTISFNCNKISVESASTVPLLLKEML